ncbi:TorD/DmsD family molecular chaperone [Amycolatopsis palatopharyngis]|uniref:TorD/DmsD family molecular chaperone n=1 Tax=Amycolatopsis palatopharyngis TaxID=187982 RepID=UPI000E243F4E|nr:molecular chaperone TorD family protein [Amycolatopsis palatopharyngis]
MIGGQTRRELLAKADIYTLGARLLAVEIDAPLYERLAGRGLTERCDGQALHQAIEDLAAEYCRLLIGPEPVCLPYASAHRSTARLRSTSERELERFLAENGLQVGSIGTLRLLGHDHLAVELAALSCLYRRVERDAAGPGDAHSDPAVRSLLLDHIAPWAPAVLHRLGAEARCAPYTSVLPVLGSLLEEDAKNC